TEGRAIHGRVERRAGRRRAPADPGRDRDPRPGGRLGGRSGGLRDRLGPAPAPDHRRRTAGRTPAPWTDARGDRLEDEDSPSVSRRHRAGTVGPAPLPRVPARFRPRIRPVPRPPGRPGCARAPEPARTGPGAPPGRSRTPQRLIAAGPRRSPPPHPPDPGSPAWPPRMIEFRVHASWTIRTA